MRGRGFDRDGIARHLDPDEVLDPADIDHVGR
jgi:hypothetical protein